MKYIIHSTVIFDTTEYLLTLLNNTNTSIKLSNSAGRILEELIKKQKTNEPITREHFFSIAWRNHGLEASHGNLNQQISLIRKNLSLLGINPTSIITVPKRGLKLSNQISIKTMKENTHNATSSSSSKNKHFFNKISLLSEPYFLKTNVRYAIILFILIITTFSISITYLYIKNKYHKQSYLCRQINSCNICTFHQTPNIECNDFSFKIPDSNKTNINNGYNNYEPCQNPSYE